MDLKARAGGGGNSFMYPHNRPTAGAPTAVLSQEPAVGVPAIRQPSGLYTVEASIEDVRGGASAAAGGALAAPAPNGGYGVAVAPLVSSASRALNGYAPAPQPQHPPYGYPPPPNGQVWPTRPPPPPPPPLVVQQRTVQPLLFFGPSYTVTTFTQAQPASPYYPPSYRHAPGPSRVYYYSQPAPSAAWSPVPAGARPAPMPNSRP